MSEFVNYHKRSVTLPNGCKDLMDVLKHGRAAGSGLMPGAITPSGPSRVGGMAVRIAEMEKCCARVFVSAAKSIILQLSSTDERLKVAFGREPGGRARTAAVAFRHDPAWEKIVVELFARHELQKPKNFEWPTFGAMLPQSPLSDYALYKFLPTPADTAQFCRIARDIFRNILNLTEDDLLDFRYVLIG